MLKQNVFFSVLKQVNIVWVDSPVVAFAMCSGDLTEQFIQRQVMPNRVLHNMYIALKNLATHRFYFCSPANLVLNNDKT